MFVLQESKSCKKNRDKIQDGNMKIYTPPTIFKGLCAKHRVFKQNFYPSGPPNPCYCHINHFWHIIIIGKIVIQFTNVVHEPFHAPKVSLEREINKCTQQIIHQSTLSNQLCFQGQIIMVMLKRTLVPYFV